MTKYKRIAISVVIVALGVLGVYKYLNWKSQKEYIEMIRSAALAKQQGHISQIVNPYLGFIPDLRQKVIVAIVEAAKIEEIEDLSADEDNRQIRYHRSLLSKQGVQNLAGRVLEAYHADKRVEPAELLAVIEGQIDTAIPRQKIAGELRLQRSSGKWSVLLDVSE